MFRVRQVAPTAAGSVPLNQRLSELTKSVINLQANGLEFSAHDALQLSVPLLRSNAAMLEIKKPKAHRHVFCSSEFAMEVMKASLKDGATAQQLDLPKYMLDPSEDITQLVPRALFHHNEFCSVTPFADMVSTGGSGSPTLSTQYGEKPRYPWPRCGLTGMFFQREEVVDNLTRAAIALQFQSPFWIPEAHPELGKFLQLKPGSQPIVISITSRVAPVEVIKILPPQLVIPALKDVRYQTIKQSDKASPFTNANVPAGINVFTGETCVNPYLSNGKKDATRGASDAFRNHDLLTKVSLPVNNRGVWVSLMQFVRHGLTLRDELMADVATDGGVNDALALQIERLLKVFVPIETQQLVLYNADQLVVPGRLSLKSKPLAPNVSGDVVSVFH